MPDNQDTIETHPSTMLLESDYGSEEVSQQRDSINFENEGETQNQKYDNAQKDLLEG